MGPPRFPLPPCGGGPGRGGIAGAALLGLALLLAACGFRPLYAVDGDAPVEELRAVQVAPIPERIGQKLRTELELLLDPRGSGGAPDYLLRVGLAARKSDIAIRKDETATRVDLALDADYALIAADDGRLLNRGRVRTVNSYNVVASDFATAAGEADATDAALRNLALQIQTQLAIFFRRRAEGLETAHGAEIPR